ncbi:putative phospholipase A(1) [Helianthus annuus]|uniref:Phospholipase A(1) n=1 Tax=Helianthus annuus TaxID=4232 RepID=A0A9K3IZ24_HELAN|nr:putative phospholipase A(1) [Helianthus annuus]KAJ0922339.1 putative phospholipase A(1) [Helianthus annuus]
MKEKYSVYCPATRAGQQLVILTFQHHNEHHKSSCHTFLHLSAIINIIINKYYFSSYTATAHTMVGRKWWCFGNQSSDDLDPVLLVTGVGGSILNSKPKSWFGFTTRVWVRILLADLEFRKKVWSLYNPDTGYAEALDDSSDIVIPQDDYGLYAIDILDPSHWIKCLHVTDVYHFHDMIDMLVNCGYKKGTTLFGYGYDFRQSNRIDQSMDGLKEKLETAYKASGGRKVNLISHSMGGLLVSCFISLHSDVFAKYVNKWITIATPFQGAPGCINDSLLTGLQFVEGLESCLFVSRWSMHQLLVECPSIYEMLPNPEFKWKKQPEIVVWRNDSENGQDLVKRETYGTSGCVDLFVEALKDNEIEYNKKTIPLPFNHDIYKWAATTRKMLNSVQLPAGIDFYNIYGTSLDTPFDVCYGSGTDPINDPSEICHTLPEYSYVDGDGTVPAESAMVP